jgi:hypothetical protein
MCGAARDVIVRLLALVIKLALLSPFHAGIILRADLYAIKDHIDAAAGNIATNNYYRP